MKLLFLKDAVYNGNVIYKAGETYEVSEEREWAYKWLRRGAVKVSEEKIDPDKESLQIEDKPSIKKSRK